MSPTASNNQSGLTADDIEHASICLLAAAAKPAVVSSALLGGSREALAALLQLPDRQLLDDVDKVTVP